MKQLRILTGLHAGARLRLVRSQNMLGNGPDADVQIADWTHQPVCLTWDEERNVVELACDVAEGEGGAMQATPLDDFAPRRFGDIVLCVGPDDDAAWPGDVDLLSRLLRPQPAAPVAPAAAAAAPESRAGRMPRAARRGMRFVAAAGSLACTVLLGGFAVLVSQSANRAEAKVPKVPLQVRVAGALASHGLDGLSARDAGRKVVVEGLVDTASDLTRVRATLQPLDDGQLVHKYASASDIAQSISDALADPALNVSYKGHGVFLVQGAAADIDRLRAAATRIALDIGPLVKRIDVSATELPPPQRVHIDAMLVSGDLRYVQTRDGTKHLIVSPRPEAPDDESGAAPLH